MQLGMIGLGRMGARLVQRLRRHGFEMNLPEIAEVWRRGNVINADFASRSLSAIRYEFGGHVEKPAS